MGGSNGGLLMGATLTQHPELVKAVVSLVGIYDMLRVELSPNGAFNVPEFGTVKDEKQFRAMLRLFAVSPRQGRREVSGRAVPDGGERPARRSDAIAQDDGAASGGDGVGAPVLLRTSAGSGHGLDTSLSERIEEYVDVYTFLFAELGVPVKP